MADTASKEDLEKIFAEKRLLLIAGLEGWFATETASIDGSIEAKAPAGAGGSIISVRAAIDSKRVVDATLITEEVLGIELPPEIIKPGGYDSCDAMIADLVPKLRAVFVGELKVKKTSRKHPAEA
jgi:hypothetical protein